MSELLYQIQNFHGFLWASGGCYSDFLIHNIDECCWMKDAWPVKAMAAAAAIIATTTSIRTSTTTRSNTPSPTAPSCISKAATSPAARRVRQLRPRHQGARRDLDGLAHAGQVPHLQGPERSTSDAGLGVPEPRAEPVPARVGRT